MKTFNDFMKLKNEVFWSRKNPLYSDPQYGKAFAALVKQNNNDEKAAEQQLRQMASTQAGIYQLQKMNNDMGSPTEMPPDPKGYRTTTTGGQQMFGGKPGSYRS